MTSIDLETNAPRTNAPIGTRKRRKSVLFCPVCGHESPVGEDWRVTLNGDEETFVCPVCDEVVASR